MYEDRCPHCGATLREYKYTLSLRFAEMLVKAAQECDRHGVFRIRNLTLTQAEYSNFAKLKFFDLIAKIEDPEGHGWWRVTPLGFNFLLNRTPVPEYAWTFRNEVVRTGGRRLFFTEVTGGWKYKKQILADSSIRYIDNKQGNLL